MADPLLSAAGRGPPVPVLDNSDEGGGYEQDGKRAHTKEVGRQAGARDTSEGPGLDRRTGQAKDGVGDYRDDDRLDPIEHSLPCLGRPVPDIGPRQPQHEQHGGRDEAGSADQESPPAAPTPGQHERHLSRGRSGEQAGASDEVEQLLLAHPATTHDELGAHEGDVSGRAAEGRQAEAEVRPRHIDERAGHSDPRTVRALVVGKRAHLSITVPSHLRQTT